MTLWTHQGHCVLLSWTDEEYGSLKAPLKPDSRGNTSAKHSKAKASSPMEVEVAWSLKGDEGWVGKEAQSPAREQGQYLWPSLPSGGNQRQDFSPSSCTKTHCGWVQHYPNVKHIECILSLSIQILFDLNPRKVRKPEKCLMGWHVLNLTHHWENTGLVASLGLQKTDK